MRARYVYSACIIVETQDVKVCCDPWFTPGAYHGSWYQYPPLGRDPIGVIGPVDLVYISHIHPDHYDPQFLRSYLEAHPNARIVIGETSPAHLARKMQLDGFEPDVIHEEIFGDTQVTIVPNNAYAEIDNLDTALVVRRGELSVVNMNDNPFDEQQIRRVLRVVGGRPRVAFLPYSAAGPYPQTYEFTDQAAQLAAADHKREEFLALYSRYVEALRPHRAVPFAGTYYLGGPLAKLNTLRGVPDALAALEREPDVTVALADGGDAFIDARTLEASATRTNPYNPADVNRYLADLSFFGYDYEREIVPLDGRSLPIGPLLSTAYSRAVARSSVAERFWFCLTVHPGVFWCFDVSHDSGVQIRSDVSELKPRLELTLDERYLFGLLTRLYHWSNARIGSHYQARRVPDVYRREVFEFLNYLQV